VRRRVSGSPRPATAGCGRMPTGRRTPGQAGFTLLEVIVTLALVAIVFVPLAGVFYASESATVTNSNEENATALASTILAKLRAAASTAIGYDSVGFSSTGTYGICEAITATGGAYATAEGGGCAAPFYYDTDQDNDSFTAAGDGDGDSADEQLVVLGSGFTTPSFTLGTGAGVQFGPVMTGVQSGGGTFDIVTRVLWASERFPGCPSNASPGSAPTSSLTQAYRRVLVKVTWSNGQATRPSYVLSGIVYPGGFAHYHGPQYSYAATPLAPMGVSAAPSSPAITGSLDVSFSVPSTFTGSNMCFSVGWSDANQVVGSTPLLSGSDPGWVLAPARGQPGATYQVDNLAQGGFYVFFVTSWSADGVEMNESADSATAQAPTGPLVKTVQDTADPTFQPAYAQGGTTSLTVTGTSLTVGGVPAQFYFVPENVGASSQFANYPMATNVSCSSSTTCTMTAPAGSASVVNVLAATPTGPGGSSVFAPPILGDQVTYAPVITGLSPASGPAGTKVQVTLKNYYPGSLGGTDFFFGTVDAGGGNGSCTTSGLVTTCTNVVAPAQGSLGPVDVTGQTGTAPAYQSTPDPSVDTFTYTS
jgi:prepilin-type N-terminal cleavage/methylation domain-containing protein